MVKGVWEEFGAFGGWCPALSVSLAQLSRVAADLSGPSEPPAADNVTLYTESLPPGEFGRRKSLRGTDRSPRRGLGGVASRDFQSPGVAGPRTIASAARPRASPPLTACWFA